MKVKQLKKQVTKGLKRLVERGSLLRHRVGGVFTERPPSVFFYTFHKCASTLFGNYVLKNMKGLKNIDYAGDIAVGNKRTPVFLEKGFVYGPIRLSASPEYDVHKLLVVPCASAEFVRDKRAIFMIRDPRDILVSAYYSYGWTHRMNPNEQRRAAQEQVQQSIKEMTLDEYVLSTVGEVRSHFLKARELREACERSVLLRYEDMLHNWELFSGELVKFITLEPSVVDEIYKRSRPKQTEDLSSHRRSGQSGGFRSKLKEETISTLNDTLRPVLDYFGYEI